MGPDVEVMQPQRIGQQATDAYRTQRNDRGRSQWALPAAPAQAHQREPEEDERHA